MKNERLLCLFLLSALRKSNKYQTIFCKVIDEKHCTVHIKVTVL